MLFRDYSESGDGLPVIVHAPFAGHSSVIADFHPHQSLMGCLQKNAGGPLYLTDWKSATQETANSGIDAYLAELNVCIDSVGGRAHLVGLCQGGWACAMMAARFPAKVASLVLAGAPLDLANGDGPIRKAVQDLPLAFYSELVALGGGVLPGAFMLQGFKNMHPFEQYVGKHIRLYEHAEDSSYRDRLESFSAWFEHPIDLPGRWYLQVVNDLFRQNSFFRGEFVGLGMRLSLGAVQCPTYLLAGVDDEITPPAQVMNARPRLGCAADLIEAETVPGGHVGLFMSHRTIDKTWPNIGRWIRRSERANV